MSTTTTVTTTSSTTVQSTSTRDASSVQGEGLLKLSSGANGAVPDIGALMVLLTGLFAKLRTIVQQAESQMKIMSLQKMITSFDTGMKKADEDFTAEQTKAIANIAIGSVMTVVSVAGAFAGGGAAAEAVEGGMSAKTAATEGMEAAAEATVGLANKAVNAAETPVGNLTKVGTTATEAAENAASNVASKISDTAAKSVANKLEDAANMVGKTGGWGQKFKDAGRQALKNALTPQGLLPTLINGGSSVGQGIAQQVSANQKLTADQTGVILTLQQQSAQQYQQNVVQATQATQQANQNLEGVQQSFGQVYKEVLNALQMK